MKILLTAMILGVILAPQISAEEKTGQPGQKVRVGISAGYTQSSMSRVNSDLSQNATGVTALGPGTAAMLDIDFDLAPFVMAGLRGGYIYCLPASAAYASGSQKLTLNASFAPVEIGFNAWFEVPDTAFSLAAGIYAGYSYANVTYRSVFELPGISRVTARAFDGMGFTSEITASAGYKLAPGLSLSLNGGYRLARIARLRQSESATYTDSPGIPHSAGTKGDILKDSNNNDLAFDFSGFNIGLGLSKGF